jgi:hypothetical protein
MVQVALAGSARFTGRWRIRGKRIRAFPKKPTGSCDSLGLWNHGPNGILSSALEQFLGSG